jgi:hypothetical protein
MSIPTERFFTMAQRYGLILINPNFFEKDTKKNGKLTFVIWKNRRML